MHHPVNPTICIGPWWSIKPGEWVVRSNEDLVILYSVDGAPCCVGRYRLVEVSLATSSDNDHAGVPQKYLFGAHASHSVAR